MPRFPRDQKRGLIEAGYWIGLPAMSQYFPAIKSGVSLKRGAAAGTEEGEGGFPRDQKRGLIEALRFG